MRRFEEKFSDEFGDGSTIAFVNGTATMHAALEAAGIGAGDEVIVPPLTMASTTFCVLQANAIPVFADVDRLTYQIDPSAIEAKITSRTKAIITVALYGLSPKMDEICRIAKKHDLIIIEDNAECFKGFYKGKLVGTFGDFASYSFQSSKHLTSGEGGALVVNNSKYVESARSVQSLGYKGLSGDKAKITKDTIQSPNYKRHRSLGWNYRMSELCCAVALAQTERVEELVHWRKKAGKAFDNVLRERVEWLVPQTFDPEVYEHSYWAFPAVLNTDRVSWETFRSVFKTNGGDSFYAAWELTYREPFVQELSFLGREKFMESERRLEIQNTSCPNAEYLQPRLIALKTNYFSDQEIDFQVNALEKTLRELD